MFRFKQFTIGQDRCPMKVGTDGVLVGAWADIRPSDKHILDIGTGTGLIALMAAQRARDARIVGVDIDDVSQARENADASPWGDRVEFVRLPIQEFARAAEPAHSMLFDHIISNPPFFVDSLTSPDAGRTAARHAVSLSFDDLRDAVVRLLAPDGRFSVILPVAEAGRFIAACCGVFSLTRRTDVRTTPGKMPKRTLMEFCRAGDRGSRELGASDTCVVSDEAQQLMSDALPHVAATAANEPPVEVRQLTIGTGEHECYTDEYRALTGDFYLKF